MIFIRYLKLSVTVHGAANVTATQHRVQRKTLLRMVRAALDLDAEQELRPFVSASQQQQSRPRVFWLESE